MCVPSIVVVVKNLVFNLRNVTNIYFTVSSDTHTYGDINSCSDDAHNYSNIHTYGYTNTCSDDAHNYSDVHTYGDIHTCSDYAHNYSNAKISRDTKTSCEENVGGQNI